jgi:hypothetical protein
MLKLLQLPQEHIWLNVTNECLIKALKAQWHDGIDEVLSGARSEWLLNLIDIRTWAHRLISDGDMRQQYAVLTLALISLPDASAETRKRYWSWLEDGVLRPMKEERDPSFQELLRLVEEKVAGSLLQHVPGDEVS